MIPWKISKEKWIIELKKNRYYFKSNDNQNHNVDLFTPDEPKNQRVNVIKTDEIIKDNSNFNNFFDNIKEKLLITCYIIKIKI